MAKRRRAGRPQRLEATQIKVEDVLFAMVKLKDARQPLSNQRNWQVVTSAAQRCTGRIDVLKRAGARLNAGRLAAVHNSIITVDALINRR